MCCGQTTLRGDFQVCFLPKNMDTSMLYLTLYLSRFFPEMIDRLKCFTLFFSLPVSLSRVATYFALYFFGTFKKCLYFDDLGIIFILVFNLSREFYVVYFDYFCHGSHFYNKRKYNNLKRNHC